MYTNEKRKVKELLSEQRRLLDQIEKSNLELKKTHQSSVLRSSSKDKRSPRKDVN